MRVVCGLLMGLVLGLAGCVPAGDMHGPSGVSDGPLNTQPYQFGTLPGTQVNTQHYHVYTTLRDPAYQRLLANVLEAAHTRFSTINPETSVPGPMDCYVFGDRSSWELYTRLHGGNNSLVYLQISSGGYSQQGIFVGYDIGRSSTLSVIAHEAWHQYSWFAFKDRLPSWLDEGIATQSEAIDWNGDQPTFRPEQNYRRYLALKQAVHENRLWKIGDMLPTHAGRVIKLSDKHVDSYYAQVWSVVLFMEHSHYKKNLQHLLADATSGKLRDCLNGTGITPGEIEGSSEHWNTLAGPRYFTQYINENIPAFEQEYLEFVTKLTSTWPVRIPKG